MRVLNLVRSRAAKAAGAVAVLAAVVAMPLSQVAFAAETPDCNTNAVVWGGASTTCDTANYSAATLQSKIQNGDGHNSAASIQSIYSGFGINVAGLSSAQDGVVTSSGNVIVNGQTVATNVWTAGRTFIQNSVAMHGVWMRPPSVSFLSSQLQAYVLMNGNQFQGAIIKSCGNPVFTINKPFGQIFKRVVVGNQTQAADDQAHAVSEATGSTFQYSVDVTNNGTADMTNTVVTDDLPSGVALANGGSSHISFPLGTISAGSHKFFTITAKVTSTEVGQCINNVASFTADQGQTGSNNAWICVTAGSGGNTTPSPSPSPSTPVCTQNQHVENGVCVTNTTTCSANQHLQNGVCVNNTPTCEQGQTLVNGMCTSANLPQTGAETGLAGMGGLGAMGYAARAYLRSKRGLLDSLRNKQS